MMPTPSPPSAAVWQPEVVREPALSQTSQQTWPLSLRQSEPCVVRLPAFSRLWRMLLVPVSVGVLSSFVHAAWRQQLFSLPPVSALPVWLLPALLLPHPSPLLFP